MLASSVRFLRVGAQVWFFLTGGIAIDFETYTVPFVSVAHFAQYLLPLAVVGLDLRARDPSGAKARVATASLLFALTTLIGIGIFLVDAGAYFNDLALFWLRTFEESRPGGGRR